MFAIVLNNVVELPLPRDVRKHKTKQRGKIAGKKVGFPVLEPLSRFSRLSCKEVPACPFLQGAGCRFAPFSPSYRETPRNLECLREKQNKAVGRFFCSLLSFYLLWVLGPSCTFPQNNATSQLISFRPRRAHLNRSQERGKANPTTSYLLRAADSLPFVRRWPEF
jgi:hypothetical protein